MRARDRRHPRVGARRARLAAGRPILSATCSVVAGQRARVGQREIEQAGLFELEDILIGRAAGVGLAAIDGELGRAALRIGAGRALAVDDEDMRRRRRLVATALGYQPVGTRPTIVAARAAGATSATRVDAAKRDQQPAVGQPGQTVGIESLAERRRAQRRRAASGAVRRPACRSREIDDRQPVGIVLGRDTAAASRASASNAVGSPIVAIRSATRIASPATVSATICRSRGAETQARPASVQTIANGNLAARHARPARRRSCPAAGPARRPRVRAVEVDQADRIVVVIGDQRAPAVGADRDARGLRLDVGAVARLVPERDLARASTKPPARRANRHGRHRRRRRRR